MGAGAVPGAAGRVVRERELRANALGNAREAPSRDDVHWLVSEALGAWHRVAALEAALAEAERARAIWRAGARARSKRPYWRCWERLMPGARHKEGTMATSERRMASEGALRQALELLARGSSFYLLPGLARVGLAALDELAAARAVVATAVRVVECFEAAEEATDPLAVLGWQVATEEAYQALAAFVDARRAATDSATEEEEEG